jgi:predicted DNA-binding protein
MTEQKAAADRAMSEATLDTCAVHLFAGRMEVHLTPELQGKLDKLATDTGRSQDEFVQDAMAGSLEELAQVRGMLDNRYDDIKSGKVKPMDGEEAFARLREKSDNRRSGRE